VSLDDAADVKPGRAVQKQLPRAKAKAKARAQPKPMRGKGRGKSAGPSKRR
jgi:hypothetical protein